MQATHTPPRAEPAPAPAAAGPAPAATAERRCSS
jgi:hypothetical protein